MKNLVQYTLHLADNALILGHRNSEWTGHGPVLEQDIALSNVALDLVGQSRNLYQYAAELKGNGATEDSLAYLRTESEFMNCLLAEQANGDWGKTIMRQFLFSAYQYPLYVQLTASSDQQLSAIANKAVKEATYHLRWSSEWVIRLGQGTEESHKRMNNALQQLWMFTDELISPAIYEVGFINSELLKTSWQQRVNEILNQASLSVPNGVTMVSGGKGGNHTSDLQQLLNEMQFMQRTYPGVEW